MHPGAGQRFRLDERDGWGTDGHRAAGAIADQLIKGSNAGAQVAALLQPGESQEKISIAEMAGHA